MSLREAYLLYVERRLAGSNKADGPLSAVGGYLAAAALMCLATTSG
jgi:hypothetical protein